MMLRERMKVGPKGQVVLPKILRERLKIYPGSMVLANIQNDKILIEKPKEDAVEIFEKIAKSGKAIKIHPHEAYEESLEHRTRKK
jgi:AbrB family looped-hinge helix DNA binding protein